MGILPRRLTRVRLAVLLGVVAVLAAAGSVLFIRAQTASARRQALAGLATVAQLQAHTIAGWRAERVADVAELAHRRLFAEIAAAPGDEKMRREVQAELAFTERVHPNETVFLTAPGGAVLAANGRAATVDETTRAEIARAARTRAPQLGDIFRPGGEGPPVLDALAPVAGAGGAAVAVVVLRCDAARSIYLLMESWPVPSATAEALLVERRGDEAVFLNGRRSAQQAALRLRLPLSRAGSPAVWAALGGRGSFEGRDDRGVAVLAAVQRVPDSPWAVVAKMDRAEALAGLHARVLATLAGALGLVLLAGFGGSFVYKAQGKAALAARLAAERDRSAALQRFETTLRSIGDAVITTGADSRVEFMNPVAERLTGWALDEARGRPLTDVFRIVNEHTRQPAENPVARVLHEGAVVGLANHTALLARDGREVPIADSGAPIRDPEGATTGVVLVFRDQTAERAAERERMLLTATIQGSLNEIYLFDADTLRFRFINQGALRNLGYSAEEIRGMTPLDIKPDLTPAAFAELLAPLRRGALAEQRFETVHERKDGSRYPVEVHVQLFEHLGERVFLAVIQDITERRRAAEARRASEAQLRALFAALPDVVLVLGRDGRYLEVAPTAATLLHPPKELLGNTVAEVFDDDHARPITAAITAAAESGRKQTVEYTLPAPGGGRTFVTTVVPRGDGTVVLVARDVTDHRRAEAQLRHAQKMEAVGTLAGGIAHDFNNLLQGLLSLVQAAQMQSHDSPLARLLAEIQRHIERGAGLTRQLLLFSRQTPTRRERLDLGALTGEHAAMLRQLLPETISLEFRPAAAPVLVDADPAQIGQVLTNLAINARDAMPAGGTLTISVTRDDRVAALEVADTGLGMTAEVQQHIFEPFFTTKPTGKGTGLGLAVVWGIAEEHGGRIEVESRPGRGTRFRFTVPLAPGDAAPAEPAPAPADLLRGHGERVLLVEDEAGARDGLTQLLTLLGYAVTATANGEEAIALPATPGFDILLTDYRLPGRTGLEVAERLAGRWPGLKVIVMSGYAPEDVAGEIFSAGAVHFLQKPFNMAALAAALRAALAATQ